VLVRPDDDEHLAHELGMLLAAPDLRARMGRAGLKRVQQFSWPSIADQYADIYTSVLTRNRQSIGA
jgi:glycosyltransferase involved in cell wall biosynthesis